VHHHDHTSPPSPLAAAGAGYSQSPAEGGGGGGSGGGGGGGGGGDGGCSDCRAAIDSLCTHPLAAVATQKKPPLVPRLLHFGRGPRRANTSAPDTAPGTMRRTVSESELDDRQGDV